MATGSGIWCMRPILRSACGSTTTFSSHRTTPRALSAFVPRADAYGDTDSMINRLAVLLLRMLFGCLLVLRVPASVWAQDSTPTAADLIVTVRDGGGAPLA